MPLETGISNKNVSTKKIKPCKKCLTGKRYANLTICFNCHCKAQKEKRIEKLAKELERKKKRKEKKQNTNQKLGKKCWRLFINKLKIEQTNFQGYLTCYTCGKVDEAKAMQGGHCFHRGRGAWRKIDFDPQHIHFQCSGCNINGGGVIPIFTANLIRDFGWEYYEKLKQGARAGGMTVEELQELYKTF